MDLDFKVELKIKNHVWGVSKEYSWDIPLRIKVIEAREPLSVQVHPDDEFAESHEGESNKGKNEIWYVLEAEENAEIILGLNRKVTRKDLLDAIEKGNLFDYLNKVRVKAGDVFFVPAGTIHSIGGGIKVLEFSDNSDITYRIYDYDRVGRDLDGSSRDLNIEKALDAAVLHQWNVE